MNREVAIILYPFWYKDLISYDLMYLICSRYPFSIQSTLQPRGGQGSFNIFFRALGWINKIMEQNHQILNKFLLCISRELVPRPSFKAHSLTFSVCEISSLRKKWQVSD